MTAKEYLEQAYRLDRRIENKMEQVQMLRHMSTKSTSVIRGGPTGGSGGGNFMEDAIARFVDMERDIGAELERLVILKAEIAEVISRVENPEAQMVLEMRYLCYKRWVEIREAMNCSERTILRRHKEGLEAVESILESKKYKKKEERFPPCRSRKTEA